MNGKRVEKITARKLNGLGDIKKGGFFMKKYYFIVLLLITISFITFSPINAENSQGFSAFPVEVQSNCNDSIGQRLVYEFKELVRKSNSMKLTTENESRIQVIIQSMDSDDKRPNIYSIYTVIWNIVPKNGVPHYFNSVMGYCGSLVISDVASRLIAQTDEKIDFTKKIIPIFESEVLHK